jgi:hypothetical protein
MNSIVVAAVTVPNQRRNVMMFLNANAGHLFQLSSHEWIHETASRICISSSARSSERMTLESMRPIVGIRETVVRHCARDMAPRSERDARGSEGAAVQGVAGRGRDTAAEASVRYG